jgi:protein ImuA
MSPESFRTALHAARTAEWRPGLAGDGAGHGEIFASSREGAGAALALALAMDRQRAIGAAQACADQRAWLWVQDTGALKRSGRPYRPGLPRELRHRLIHVAARSPADALFAIEEGLRCRELAFVIGEITGNPRALSFTASRRLSLAVEKHGVPLWLVRLDAARDLGSARLRWEARAAASLPSRWNPQAPGMAGWHAELFRARSHPPGQWVLREEGGLVAERVASLPSPALQERAEIVPVPFTRSA